MTKVQYIVTTYIVTTYVGENVWYSGFRTTRLKQAEAYFNRCKKRGETVSLKKETTETLKIHRAGE